MSKNRNFIQGFWPGIRQLYLSNRFFLAYGGVILLFLLAFPFPFFFYIALSAFAGVSAMVLIDLLLLYQKNTDCDARRIAPKVLSLSDSNAVAVEVSNLSPIPLNLTIIDELPEQFQVRDFRKKLSLSRESEHSIQYQLRPVTRGSYVFGNIQLFAESQIGLIQRKFSVEAEERIPVYPSIVQMKQFALKAFNKVSMQKGMKKIRRIGHSYEFEQIKNYVRGDDYRSINWKATGRKSALMVNQYEDERAQQVYSLIDKSRSMRLPFNGLSLMDYAINTSLAISNIALQKHDKAGLITFSDKLGTVIKAERKANQLNQILQALYREKERPLEANYELLYQIARKLIKGRSLLLLYTHFESTFALERVLPILRRMNTLHLLVVIFFENTEIEAFSQQPVETVEGIYTQTVAENYLMEKRQMVQTLRQYGIQSVITRPEELTLNTINKYLELKSRGLI